VSGELERRLIRLQTHYLEVKLAVGEQHKTGAGEVLVGGLVLRRVVTVVDNVGGSGEAVLDLAY
jgi:hypothetical protein